MAVAVSLAAPAASRLEGPGANFAADSEAVLQLPLPLPSRPGLDPIIMGQTRRRGLPASFKLPMRVPRCQGHGKDEAGKPVLFASTQAIKNCFHSLASTARGGQRCLAPLPARRGHGSRVRARDPVQSATLMSLRLLTRAPGPLADFDGSDSSESDPELRSPGH